MEFFYVYPPERYTTTYIKQTFPESRWPLEHTRHAIGHALHDLTHLYEYEIRNPRTDVRETLEKFYIDIELPGLMAKEDYSLKWTNPSTLLIQAEIKRPEIKDAAPVAPADSQTKGTEADKSVEAGATVHFLTRERRVGIYARAFSFHVGVEHENLEAVLKFGLLSIVLPKKESEQHQPKHVDVQHVDS